MEAGGAREGTRFAVVVVDREGVILSLSGDAESLLGHEPATVLGKRLDVLVPPEYRERHWNGFQVAMRTGVARAEGFGASIPVLCADGEVRRFPGRFTLVRDAYGRAHGAAAVIVEPSADDPSLFEL